MDLSLYTAIDDQRGTVYMIEANSQFMQKVSASFCTMGVVPGCAHEEVQDQMVLHQNKRTLSVAAVWIKNEGKIEKFAPVVDTKSGGISPLWEKTGLKRIPELVADKRYEKYSEVTTQELVSGFHR